ncbi:MAG: DMT family transporter [Rhodobacteraceae bacterium]|nr:DMT family transporter [Paracoccaceae bacterium]
MQREFSYLQSVVMVVLAAVFWSLMALVIRFLGDAGTWQILLYRSLGMIPVLAFFIWRRSQGKTLARIRRAGLPGLVGGTGLAFAFAGAIYAIQATSVANAVLLFAAAPLMTAVMAWALLKEPVRPATWGAIALASIGVFMMVRVGLNIGTGWGSLAALMSAGGFAAFTVTLRWGRMSDMLPAVLIGGLISVVVASLVITLRGDDFMLSAGSVVLAMAMGAILLGIGMSFYTAGSRAVDAAQLGVLSLAEVMLAPVWVWLFLGESTSRDTLIGGAILLLAIAFNAASGMRHRPAKLI